MAKRVLIVQEAVRLCHILSTFDWQTPMYWMGATPKRSFEARGGSLKKSPRQVFQVMVIPRHVLSNNRTPVTLTRPGDGAHQHNFVGETHQRVKLVVNKCSNTFSQHWSREYCNSVITSNFRLQFHPSNSGCAGRVRSRANPADCPNQTHGRHFTGRGLVCLSDQLPEVP